MYIFRFRNLSFIDGVRDLVSGGLNIRASRLLPERGMYPDFCGETLRDLSRSDVIFIPFGFRGGGAGTDFPGTGRIGGTSMAFVLSNPESDWLTELGFRS